MFRKNNRIGQKKGSKSYISHKTYNNPYFKNVNKKSKSSISSKVGIKVKIFSVLFITLIGFIFWIFLYSKYFLIHDLQIKIDKAADISRVGESEIEKLTREQLRSKYIFLPANNIFLFDEQKLYNKINNKFAFEEINIEKKLPNKLIINLKEVSYALVWKEEGKLYYITTDGEIINEITQDEIKPIFPIIENKGRDLIVDGKISNENKDFEFAIKLYKEFKDTNILNIENFIVGNQNDNTLTMKIFEGPEVYFNVLSDYDNQTGKLLLLKNEKLKDDLFSKTYVDLRFGDTIYYR